MKKSLLTMIMLCTVSIVLSQNTSDEEEETKGFSRDKLFVGLNLFGRVYPIQNFMLQVQPEANYVFGKEIYYDSSPRQEYTMDARIVPSLLLGGGLVLPSGRGATIISVFYDVLQNENSPYSNRPIFNFTFNMGL